MEARLFKRETERERKTGKQKREKKRERERYLGRVSGERESYNLATKKRRLRLICKW